MGAHRAELELWLNLLDAKGVEELVFVNRPWPLDFPLPATIFSLPSVKRLYLGSWRFPSTGALPRGTAFPHLLELGLGCVALEERDLDFILAKSPVLETLVVYSSQKHVNLRIIARRLRCVQLCMCIVHDISVVDAPCLERLFLWEVRIPHARHEKVHTRVKFVHAPKLRFVGYLEPGVHVLEVGNTTVKVDTRASPRTIIPSVKTLALKVHFEVRNEAKMIPSFLRCFPNIETLHIKSEKTDQPAGKLDQKFWQEINGIECVQSHIREMVFHEYRGERSEFAFLKFILENAQVLREIVIVFVKGSLSSRDNAAAAELMKDLSSVKMAGANCRLVIAESSISRGGGSWSCQIVGDLLRDSDFLLASNLHDDSARAAAAAAIGRVLADHPGPFRKVQLTCCVFESQGRELAEWARLLAAKCVRDLVLVDLEGYFPGAERPLPDDILSCASLHRLFLGYCIFPDTTAVVHRGNDVVFPLLKDLVMHKTDMRDSDLEHMLACSPKLKRLALMSISRLPQRIRLCGPNLQCMVLWMSLAEELAVVDAPRLERLILWKTCAGNESGDNMVVKIDQKASELHVLGYLEPRVHQLQIGNVIINAQTKASSSSIVASVKILALKVNLGVFKDVNLLLAFLECFPNIETLHIESSILGEPTGTLHAKFWTGVRPIECLKAHIKKIVIHEFRGHRSEFQFLMFIAMRVEKLQFLLPVLTKEKSTSTDEVDEVSCQLKILFASVLWATEYCQVLLMEPEKKNALSFPRASDLSINDPFM